MKQKKIFDVQNIVLIAVFVALMAVCSWISFSIGQITYTLQTFAVFLTAGILGSKRGTVAVIIYILLGIVGVPVFAGFSGGLSAVAGYLGGFIIGFIPLAVIVGLVSDYVKIKSGLPRIIVLVIAMFLGDAVCFLIGGIWFKQVLAMDWAQTFALSMAPYIVPDIIKMILAATIVERLKKYIKL